MQMRNRCFGFGSGYASDSRCAEEVLLRERAVGRGMAAVTYASMVLRAHLRPLTPLPERELLLEKPTEQFDSEWGSSIMTPSLFASLVYRGVCRLEAHVALESRSAELPDEDRLGSR
jgi:hypothetical protein